MSKIFRYMALASALLLTLALAVVAWVYNAQSTRDLVEMTTVHNVAVDRILSNTVLNRYRGFLEEAEGMEAEALRARPETREIGFMLTIATRGVPVLKAKIFDAQGTTLFSTEFEEIGETHPRNETFLAALSGGRPVSELSYEDEPTPFSGEDFDRAVVETYLPRRDPSGKIIGVFEIYTDVTAAKARIDDSTINLVAGLTAVFTVVYAILVVGIIGRAVEPIGRASRLARRIGPDRPGQRLPVARMPSEMLPLLHAINDALDRLDAALASQRRFVADAAHELMTPLAVMRAQVDLLEDEAQAAPLRRDVDEMTEMVRQLLAIAELEGRGERVPDADSSDLRAAAAETAAALAPLAAKSGRRLSLTGAEGPVPVRASDAVLGHVLRNLVENALRHSPQDGSVEIRVSSDGVLRVLDEGPGVAPEDRETVFERFWRGESSGSSGLGLSLVRRLAEGLGGRAWVEDAPGGGACLAVAFPLAEDAPADDAAMEPATA